MSNRGGAVRGHRFHGDPARFEVVARYVRDNFGREVRYIADVAGGQGMLSRFLNRFGYESEVVDPRGWTLKGVKSRPEAYDVSMADYYDLVVGLHPDQATRPVVESARVRPVLVVPCCNFWDRDQKLGRDALVDEIERYVSHLGVSVERVVFDFKGPMNLGVVAGRSAG